MIDLEVGANLELDLTQVPERLISIANIVKKWGFASQDEQDVFVREMKRHRKAEVSAFNMTMDAYADEIREWNLSLTQFDKDVADFTAEDWKHPLWAYLNAKKVRELTGPSTDRAGVDAMLKRHRDQVDKQRFKTAVELADESFRTGRYSEYVATLSEFQRQFTPAIQKKFDFAKRKSAELRVSGD